MSESSAPPPSSPVPAPAVNDNDRLFRAHERNFLEHRGDPPLWRRAHSSAFRGSTHIVGEAEREAVKAALYLRRPLLVTGAPGIGKSSLAYAVAEDLGLGDVLVWPITSRSTLQQGLYTYDALGRLEKITREKEVSGKVEEREEDIGKYLTLGPLGTALQDSQDKKPRVLLIDELDKSDIDLPNDLLHVLEEGTFVIPELKRLNVPEVPVKLHIGQRKVPIKDGEVTASAAPFILITSNGEREFPPAFLRRCLRIEVKQPSPETLARIVIGKLEGRQPAGLEKLLEYFGGEIKKNKVLATDQLLNAAFLMTLKEPLSPDKKDQLERILQPLL